MKFRVLSGVLWLAALLPTRLLAQLQITSPANRIVYQRNAANQAPILIAGTYAQPVDKVEARLVPVNGGTATDWTLVQTNPRGGAFSGQMTINAGWYTLEVRGTFQDRPVGQARLDRVGVGEVLLIMGHSNAQGGFSPSKGATDERVVGADYGKIEMENYLPSGDPNFLSGLDFVSLCQTCGIAPFNGVPWVWSQLGDLLVKKLNVPVLFYSAAFGGTNMEQNYKVIKGIPFEHGFVNYRIGMPYANLKNALMRYVPTTGLRGVLALHGENDRFSSKDDIVKFYQTTIEQSRLDAGKPDLAWVVAVSSFNSGVWENVTAAQREVIATTPHVYDGPNLDLVNSPEDRPDRLHYSETGQTKVAALWDEALTPGFFQSANPMLPQPPPIATLSCVANNALTLRLPDAYSQYRWSNGSSGDALTTTAPGMYQGIVRDAAGNFRFAPAVRVPEQVGPPRPTLLADGPTAFCPGGRVTLTGGSPSATRYEWSTGTGDPRITVATGGTYRFRAFDNVNCFSENSVDVRVYPEPTKPTVQVQGALFFCDTTSVTFIATSQGADSTYRWNTGINARTLLVGTSGEFRVRGLNRFGCFSPESDPLRTSVVPTPEAPLVEKPGPFTLQASNQRRVTRYDWQLDNGPLTTQGNLFKTPRDGRYRVRAYLDSAQAGGAPIRCFSKFSDVYTVELEASDGFVVYPVPSSDGYVTLDTREVWSDLNVSVLTGDGTVLFNQTYPTFDGRLRLYLGPVPGKYYVHARVQNVRSTKAALVVP